MRLWLAGALMLGAACGSEAPPGRVAPGTYLDDPRWAARRSALGTRETPGGVRVQGAIAILEGDSSLVSGSTASLGLRMDAEKNDLAAIVARFSTRVADVPAILVLFTEFPDQGGGGPAYAVPIYNPAPGLGVPPIDQRGAFGTQAILSIANLKRRSDHPEDALIPLIAHEIGHVSLAHLDLVPSSSTSTETVLLGRQRAHWNAALDTEGSVLEGYGYAEIAPGDFVVNAKRVRFSELDLYGLGLLPAAEVRPMFRIEDAQVQSGAKLPAAAELTIGDHVFGRRTPVRIEEIVAVCGPRPPAASHELWAVFALLTTPGVPADDPEVQAEAAAIDRLRVAVEAAWPELTRGHGTLRTTLPEPRPDAGTHAEVPVAEASGCRCMSARASGFLGWIPLLLAARNFRRRPGFQ